MSGLAVWSCAYESQIVPPRPTAFSETELESLSDGQVLGLLALIDKEEIEVARLAQERTRDPRVLAFAARMVRDHTALLHRETDVSEEMKVVLVQPDEATQFALHHAARQRLAALSGAEFDGAYLDHVIMMHEWTRDFLSKAVQITQDPTLRHLMLQSKPIIDSHVEAARKRSRR